MRGMFATKACRAPSGGTAMVRIAAASLLLSVSACSSPSSSAAGYGDADGLAAGRALWLRGRAAEAIPALERAWSGEPASAEAGIFLARAYRSEGRPKAAADIAARLLEIDPQDLRALRLSASLALDTGDVRVASARLDAAIASASEAGFAFLERSRLRWAAGDGIGARSDAERAVLLLPEGSAAARGAEALRGRIAEAYE